MNNSSNSLELCAARVYLGGHVQGIGYRPALARLARSCGVRGWVRNTAAGIEVHVEGMAESLVDFIESCEVACPQNGAVTSRHVQMTAPQSAVDFAILAASSSEPTATAVPRDAAVCAACLAEVSDPSDHRHNYLLTSCSSCGPRYSIIHRMPYERDSTAMAQFPPCSDCFDEYQSRADRRFHTQSIACADCGPTLTDIYSAVECLAQGKILAIKGVGGFQLLVDAQNVQAIQRLRENKRRPSKPLAVMLADCASVRAIVEFLSDIEDKLLSSPQAPIVVLRLRPGALPTALAPHVRTIGVMLPTTPLHAWLARAHGPLVVTSGNVEGLPLSYESEEAKRDLASVADAFLDHDRPIVRPIDDSVARVIAGRSATLRLARGLAPLPIQVTSHPAALEQVPHLLALGAHQKAAIALCNGRQAILGQHIGDLDTLETRTRFERHVSDMLELYSVRPKALVHDAHSDYFTSQWAEQYCREHGIRRMAVQHHHAHIVAGMVEQYWLERKVLGVAWDGTGLGSDGTLWGGEFLLATASGFERTACLRPLALPGGETAIREPWRIAAAMLCELRGWDATITHRLPDEALIEPIVNNRRFSPLSTSVGRLFDGVAALVLPDADIRLGNIGHEGHFAAMLEDLCNLDAEGVYPFPVSPPDRRASSPTQQLPTKLPRWLDWRPLVRSIVHELDSGVARADIAMRFHRSLAAGIQEVARLHPGLPIVLGGGVFQNKVLVELLQAQLADCNVAFPGEIPCGDGGLAAGQLAIACAQLEQPPCA